MSILSPSVWMQKLKRDGLFLLLFFIFTVAYYPSIIKTPPLNNHTWRQSDCLSITRYYARGAGFFEPEMNMQLGDYYTTGKTAGEFPILYYTVGQIWKITGESYFVYRVFYLIILFFGIYAFYRSLRLIFNDNWWALVLSGLLFTAPVLIFYGVSFLTDAPAFCFILIGLYFLLRYHLEQTKKVFLLAMLFFALAGLIKVSSLIAFVFLLFIFLLEMLSVKTLGSKKVFQTNWFEALGFLGVLAMLFSWYAYASHYNDLHRFKYTFNNIYPLWDPEEGGIPKLWKTISTYSSYVFFSRPMIFLMAILLVTIPFLLKKIPLFAYLSTLIVTIGVACYILLWGPLLGVHDYYYVALLILFPAIVVPAAWYIKSRFPTTFSGKTLKVLLTLFLVYNFIYAVSVTQLKTLAIEGNYPIVGNASFVREMHWLNWNRYTNIDRFERMKVFLLQKNIQLEDRIIYLNDPSFNVPLYALDRKGWTDYEEYTESKEIRLLIHKGAKYLFLPITELKKEAYLQPFLTDSIADFEGVTIYRLSASQ
jgi:hypothetical protein